MIFKFLIYLKEGIRITQGGPCLVKIYNFRHSVNASMKTGFCACAVYFTLWAVFPGLTLLSTASLYPRRKLAAQYELFNRREREPKHRELPLIFQ